MGRLDLEALRAAYAGKKVLLTGHTGFKGGWLAVWLEALGAEVSGYALAPSTDPALVADADVAATCRSVIADIRDVAALRRAVGETAPDVVFHLAAQPIVRLSYEEPIATLETNVMGTAHLLEAVRLQRRRCAVVVVTSDKCYENREWPYGYREEDAMGGHDPYSMSKGAAELVAASWRRSFFPPDRLGQHGVAVATARAGNVIGGGDWAKDRIVPDAIRALSSRTPVPVRNPGSVRPWQHVLEPLSGYLVLGARLLGPDAARFCEPFNFGPTPDATQPVSAVVSAVVEAWGSGSWQSTPQAGAPHEAGVLRLAVEKAYARLGWSPRWGLQEAVRETVEWYRARAGGASPGALRALMLRQIERYVG
jgi:CDP-glucose 4,6-dehydratase